MHPTIPPTTTTPIVSTVAQQHRTAPIAKSTTGAAQKLGKLSTVAMPNWQDRSPLTSPDIQAKPKAIAQSELPGGSTPPPAPPVPTNRPTTVDTGDGYPTSIPANYFGPAIGFGTGSTSFGVISRFPFGTNYSIRPSAVFGNGGTIVRVPVTYDFALGDREPFERNPLVTFHAGGGVQYSSGIGGARSSQFGLLGTIGVDVNLFEGVALVGSFNTDFASVSGTNIGLGFEF
ncbi:hypothetical protein [Chamaesiphon polymorphus]|uniref:Outer membrane protein beta-barrel domain-containing protein n=1 Tax=Chamaesiphon polymorphus CCALA 037 TaxID=2107692 RepID=A0A2T1GJE8_9CYAN|nr:hypothetical protein [Chamaesiphon polymorphus]PSB57925.1 hypothetical protein C7B77_06575 [Chamaesiphon polymorphus CCALA 037]